MNVAINKVAVTVRISTVAAVEVNEATVKQVLGISPSGSATKYLNEQGNFTTPAGGGGSVAWGSITGTLSAQTDLQTALNAKQASGDYATNTALTNGLATKQDTLGFTPENISNKSTSVNTDQASNTKYPSVKAVYDWVIGLGYITSAALSGYATQAWVAAQGYITNVVTALGYTPANKAGDTFTGSISATNLSGTNSGDETQNTIKTKLGAASALQDGYLTSANWSTFNGKQDALGFTPENAANKSTSVTTDQGSDTKYPSVKAVYDWIVGLAYVQNTRSISTSSPLSGGGDLSANRTISIQDAAADGSTKGAAAFTAADFNSSAGVISLDYTNGQAASASAKGFLTSADWSTFNAKQAALGFTAENVANKSTTFSTDKASDTKYPSVKSVYDYYAYFRTFYQTTAESSLTGSTAETLIDTVTIPANTLAANDIIQLFARILKTTTAGGTLRIYINSSGSLSGATLLGTYTLAAANRFAGFERQIAVKASGLLEVLSATNTSNLSDENALSGVETTTTVTLSNTLYLLVSMQLANSADTMRRSFCQVQIQRAL